MNKQVYNFGSVLWVYLLILIFLWVKDKLDYQTSVLIAHIERISADSVFDSQSRRNKNRASSIVSGYMGNAYYVLKTSNKDIRNDKRY